MKPLPFVLVLFQINSLVNFAVGFKYTTSSKRGKNFLQGCFVTFAQRKSYAELRLSLSTSFFFLNPLVESLPWWQFSLLL